uniref:Uncharacterized protein n=1 Tax=Oryza glumipatula TaxID=40148 RepID=A0A0D9YDY1_9ORYZ
MARRWGRRRWRRGRALQEVGGAAKDEGDRERRRRVSFRLRTLGGHYYNPILTSVMIFGGLQLKQLLPGNLTILLR